MEMSSRSHGSSSSSPSTPTHKNSPLPMSSSSEPNSPYPTTFVTADSTSFKQVVQMLTGSSDPNPMKAPPTPCSRNLIKTSSSNKKQQLYERRNSLKNSLLMINPLPRYQNSPEILSPSVLDFPSLTLTPVSSSEEERAIADKGFYLHPSPTHAVHPQLLPLFPLTSPTLSHPSSY